MLSARLHIIVASVNVRSCFFCCCNWALVSSVVCKFCSGHSRSLSCSHSHTCTHTNTHWQIFQHCLMQAAIQWLLYWRRKKKNLIELRKHKRDDLNNLFLRKGLPGRLWSPLMCELSGLGWSKNTGSLQRRAAGLYKPHGLSDRLFFFFLPRVNHSHIQSKTTSINLNPLLCVCHVTLFPSRHTQWERAWSWLSGPDVSLCLW